MCPVSHMHTTADTQILTLHADTNAYTLGRAYPGLTHPRVSGDVAHAVNVLAPTMRWASEGPSCSRVKKKDQLFSADAARQISGDGGQVGLTHPDNSCQ
ncbi:hypothetical protein XENOCAPTIV_003897 [Xenoophorus captivus]|uniref:Uncharacterized protein n=1 Tax=Xenoophorus captivus TaxID=1517983 RepID=A0ABV0Q7W8_9TELE